MRSKVLWTVVACLLFAPAAWSKGGSALPSIKASNPSDCPVQIVALGTFEKPISSPDDLRLKFRLRNVSKVLVRHVEIEASVYSSGGDLKGMYGFTVRKDLKPGQESFVLERTGLFQVAPTDRVVLAPVHVLSSGGEWKMAQTEVSKGAS